MKSIERVVAATFAIISIVALGLTGYQTYAVLPYRVDQTELRQKATDDKIARELEEVRRTAEAERAKSEATRESLIRIEEQMKSVKMTVESIDRKWKYTASNPPN